MKIAYWIVAGLLALLYGYAGGIKLVHSKEQLRPLMQWVDDLPLPAVRAIGAVELIGVVGLVLPPVLGIAPVLSLAAAVGFVALQLGATRVHLRRGEEVGDLRINLTLLLLAVAAIWLSTAWL